MGILLHLRILLLFFLEFSIMGRVGRNGSEQYVSLSIWVFITFKNFLPIFLEFCITRRLGTDRNDNFLYLSFLAFSNVFWIQMKP